MVVIVWLKKTAVILFAGEARTAVIRPQNQ
jgi:hypothetical protein